MRKTQNTKRMKTDGFRKYKNSFSGESGYSSARTRRNGSRRPVHKRRSRTAMHLSNAGITIICTLLIALVFTGFFRLFNSVKLTNAEPDTEVYSASRDEESASVREESLETSPQAAAAAAPSAITLPTASPAEGSPEYMFKYPEMCVERAWFKEADPDKKVVYMTFDDGPSANTDKILEQLDLLDVKATFFVTSMYDSREAVVAKLSDIYSRGHGLGVHTSCHDYKKIYASVDAYLDDFKLMDDMILEATGKRSGIYRYPGGSNTGYNENIRNEMLIEMMRRGFVFHDWNASNGDSDGLSAWDEIEKAIFECKSQNRSILLLHDAPGKAQVPDSLEPIVTALRADGYQFELLDETVQPVQFITLEPVG